MSRWLLALLAAALASPVFAQLPPDKALASMTAGDGLQVELFAAEPMLMNPTSMDVDHLGRVWVAEAVNYRRVNFNRPILRPEGDRVVILTDKDGDGKADESTVFYQGKDLYGPLGVCVLPIAGGKPGAVRVLVCQSPDILEFFDRDGDGKADGPPTKFLTGFGGFDHDHGVHGITTGPDGKLYFTVGDSGVTGLQSKDGKGKKWVTTKDPKGDCQAGTVWRCDPDGTNLELIAHNFRNNYEACVDSFGEVWLSDNDDDGNQQTRICFVMPGGNYGYWPRGAGQTHWHEEQPGVVHKTLRTGFGSPTGICFYEGSLLGDKFAGALLHADAGPREIRAFHRKPKGAGYELDKTAVLTSTDNWFRPSDVCVAPDGSVFVADWYDPGVGGHGMGDHTRGRVYRVSPKGHAGYKVPEVELGSKRGMIAAIGSPNLAVRYAAAQAIAADVKPKPANPAAGPLDVLVDKNQKRLSSADAWLLARLRWLAVEPVKDVLKNSRDAQAGLVLFLLSAGLEPGAANAADQHAAFGQLPRLYRLLFEGPNAMEIPPGDATKLLLMVPGANPNRPLAEVPVALRREAMLALARLPAAAATPPFYQFAKLYDGRDPVERAVLNIALGTDPARRDAVLADFDKHFPEWTDTVADLVWELRPKSVLPRLEKLMADAKLTAAQKARVVDILAASDDPAAGKTMLTLVTGDHGAEVKARAIDNLRLFLPTKWNALAKGDELKAAIKTLLADPKAAAVGLKLASAAKYVGAFDGVAAVANDKAADPAVRKLAVATLGELETVRAPEALEKLLADPATAADAVAALGTHIGSRGPNSEANKKAMSVLQGLVTGKADATQKSAALAALAGSRAGTGWLLQQQEAKTLPADLAADAGRLLRNSPFQGERNKAMLLFPAPGKLDPKKLPPLAELAKRKGDAANGAKIMAKSITSEAQCLKCHMVQGQGGHIGPDLSLIGKKGSRENLFESILVPSKAIADQYVSWQVEGEDGQSITGLLVGETETTLTLRDANGKDYTLPAKGTSRKKSLVSIMPDGLAATLTEDELVDLVEYLTTLQTPSLSPEAVQFLGPFPAADDAALDAPTPVESGSAEAKGKDGKVLGWEPLRPAANGYFDLAAKLGPAAPRSLSYLKLVVDSPVAQEAMVLLGTDDGCRLWVNGEKLFGHDRHEAATPGRDRVPVKLKAGANTLLLKVNNGNNPHGAYLSVLSPQELKVAK